jgi:cytochrome c553
MVLRLAASSLLVFAACIRSTTTVATPPAEEDCTLATALTPGVPGSPGHLIPSDTNPNGASELAMLMRSMVADLEKGKQALEKGEALEPMWPRHRKMRCSWPTDPSDRNEAFDAMAVTYLAQVKALDAKPANLRAAFNRVVAACQACHENSCPGPIEKIASLKVAEVP